MGFWKSLLGGGDSNPEEDKKNADAKQFDLMKYDGIKALRIGQADYAIKCFHEALKVHDDLEVRDYLSRAFLHTGQLDEALNELKTIAAQQTDNLAVLMQAAHVAFMKEDYGEMKAICEQALRQNDAIGAFHYMYGQACLGEGDQIGGIARLTRAIALKDDLAEARLLRAQTLLKMGDAKGAAEDCSWLLKNDGSNEDVLLLAARLAHIQGNDEVALNIYGIVTEVNPFRIEAYRERGKIRFDSGDKQGAEEDMQKVLELNPNELSGVNGDYQAEGVEQQVKRAYSNMNPFGI